MEHLWSARPRIYYGFFGLFCGAVILAWDPMHWPTLHHLSNHYPYLLAGRAAWFRMVNNAIRPLSRPKTRQFLEVTHDPVPQKYPGTVIGFPPGNAAVLTDDSVPMVGRSEDPEKNGYLQKVVE